jgi:hypothetical protein
MLQKRPAARHVYPKTHQESQEMFKIRFLATPKVIYVPCNNLIEDSQLVVTQNTLIHKLHVDSEQQKHKLKAARIEAIVTELVLKVRLQLKDETIRIYGEAVNGPMDESLMERLTAINMVQAMLDNFTKKK